MKLPTSKSNLNNGVTTYHLPQPIPLLIHYEMTIKIRHETNLYIHNIKPILLRACQLKLFYALAGIFVGSPQCVFKFTFCSDLFQYSNVALYVFKMFKMFAQFVPSDVCNVFKLLLIICIGVRPVAEYKAGAGDRLPSSLPPTPFHALEHTTIRAYLTI